MNVLAYVHLRNIYNSTGAGRVSRNLTEVLGRLPDVSLQVLADRGDHARLPADIGEPWSSDIYRFFSADTSRQQARWMLTRRPTATHYWPEAHVTFCTGESFVPKGRSKLVVTAHDAAYFESAVHEPTWSTWKQWAKWRWLFATLSSQADMIHTVSEFSAGRLGHFFPQLRPRIRVVHNGISARFFQPPTLDSSAVLDRHDLRGRRYVHVPGGLSVRKNAALILEAWPAVARELPDVLLAVSGHVSPDFRAQTARLGASLRLLGFVTDEELHRVYADAQLTWFPSRYEGFGIPVLESLAGGTPVISSDVASIPEIAGGHALLLPPDDVNRHRAALIDLLRADRERDAMRDPGRRHAAQFTWLRAAEQLSSLFRQLL